MKKFLQTIAYKTLLRRPYVRYCSQTIYESLLGCMRMWEATSKNKRKERADKILGILLKIQRPDGGFDNGYDFNFGRLHKKGQSTAPELVGLVALTEYAKLFGKDKVFDAAWRAWNRFLMIIGIRVGYNRINGLENIVEASHALTRYLKENGHSFADCVRRR